MIPASELPVLLNSKAAPGLQSNLPLTFVKLGCTECPRNMIRRVVLILRTGTLQTGVDPLAWVVGPIILPVFMIKMMLAEEKLGPTLLTLPSRLHGIPVLVSSMPTRLGT